MLKYLFDWLQKKSLGFKNRACIDKSIYNK